MATATPTHSTPPADEHVLPPHGPDDTTDPDHDIDTKRTVIVLAAVSAFVFGSVWILYFVYSIVMQQQIVTKVEQAPTPQIDALRAWEAEMLGAGEDPKRKSIEDSIRELTSR